jgi:hypothetical protein
MLFSRRNFPYYCSSRKAIVPWRLRRKKVNGIGSLARFYVAGTVAVPGSSFLGGKIPIRFYPVEDFRKIKKLVPTRAQAEVNNFAISFRSMNLSTTYFERMPDVQHSTPFKS